MQIEARVHKRIDKNDGVYLPPDHVIGHVDFSGDTPDGKQTFNGTAMAIYQSTDAQDKVPILVVDTTIQSRSKIGLISYKAPRMHMASIKSNKASSSRISHFSKKLPSRIKMQDYTWIPGHSLARVPKNTTGDPKACR